MRNFEFCLNKVIEISLFLLLVILPFSYVEIDVKHIGLIVAVVLVLLYFVFAQKTSLVKIETWKFLIPVLFILMLGFVDKVDFIRLFNLSFDMDKRIPLSSIILSFSFLAYLLKSVFSGKFTFPQHNLVRYFIVTAGFLFVLMFLFFPFMHVYHKMNIETDLKLLSNIVKYVFIFFVITDYLEAYSKIKKLNIGLVFSLSICVLLKVILA